VTAATSYLSAVRLFNRDVRLVLVSAALMGFTLFGGIYSLLVNLYILRLGYGPEFVGLLHAVGLVGWAAMSVPSGLIGRRWGSRRGMIAGMGLSLLAYGALPLAEFAPPGLRAGWLLVTYLLGNVLISLYDVNQGPFLMGVTTERERDHVFAVMAAIWPLAGFVGSAIGGLLPGAFAGWIGVSTEFAAPYRYPLLIAAASLMVGAWALASTRGRPAAAAPSAPGDANAAGQAPAAAREPAPIGLIAFLGIVLFLQVAGEGVVRTFFSVYLDNGLRTSTALIGGLSAFGQLLAIPAALAMPLVAARWGHRRTFLLGTLGMALSLLPLALVPHWAGAGLGYMAMIALASLTRPAVTIYLLQIVPPTWRETMSGGVTMALGLSWAVGSLAGGYIITGLGYTTLFLLATAVTLASVAVFVLGARRMAVRPANL
jgi:MFS family permease